MRVVCAMIGVLAVMIADAPRPEARSSPALFEFRSAFWVNLHHYLQALGRERWPLPAALPPAATAAERDVWEAAVSSYRRRYGGLSLLDAELVTLKTQLIAAPSAESLRGSAVRPEDATLLEAVAPAYRRLVWLRHDAANVRFAAAVQPLLARFGDEVASRLARSLDSGWPSHPVRADLVSAIDAGAAAYTTNHPTHITIEVSDRRNSGLAALERLFREASYGWGRVLRSELDDAAAALKLEVPRDLPDAVMAYNAGEIMRRVLVGAGIPGYRMSMEAENTFPGFRQALGTHWAAYLDGRGSRQEALRRILASVLPRGASFRTPTARGPCRAAPSSRPAAPC